MVLETTPVLTMIQALSFFSFYYNTATLNPLFPAMAGLKQCTRLWSILHAPKHICQFSAGASGSGIQKAGQIDQLIHRRKGEVTFGESLAKAGLTEDDIDSFILMKDVRGVPGLPPLEELFKEDPEAEKKAKRREMELTKQQELAKSWVRKVDGLGRAYATGRRKTSIARVWVMKGKGVMSINGKTYDNYFPDLDHRVQILEPFLETKSLGAFDVKSTVKGGGISGQAGALRLGISRALQYFDPALRPPLRAGGMLTRDSRIVERKKPGKAKARKSFQWVKR